MHNAVAISRHRHKFRIAPVASRVEKHHEIIDDTAALVVLDVSEARDVLNAISVRSRHPHVLPSLLLTAGLALTGKAAETPLFILFHHVHSGWHEIDAKSGPRRQWPIEKMNWKVAGEPTIGEPAPPQRDFLTFLVVRGRVKRHSGQQKWKAEAHPHTDDDGNIGGTGQTEEVLSYNNPSASGSSARFHPLYDIAWK